MIHKNLKGITEEMMLKDLEEVGGNLIYTFHEKLIKALRKVVKGEVSFYFNKEDLEIIYIMSFDEGTNYQACINFDEIIESNFNVSLHFNTLLDMIKNHYIRKILK